MKIAVLGTGVVGETIGARLVQLGHQVMLGSRSATNEKATAWTQKNGANATHGTFADAAAFAENLIFNCTKGDASVEVLRAAGAANLRGKVLLDVSNPLDFSKGMPPTLAVCNTDSLGEQIQRAFPELRVVKTLNTLNCFLMVDPTPLAGGDHTIFLSGNDAPAKEQARDVLRQFGWRDECVLDLGDITTARGTEMLLPIWLRLWGALGSANFNFKIVQ